MLLYKSDDIESAQGDSKEVNIITFWKFILQLWELTYQTQYKKKIKEQFSKGLDYLYIAEEHTILNIAV